MPACDPIIVSISESPSMVLSRARQAVGSSGASLTGDDQRGSFSGAGVKGTYEFNGNTLIITITDKPFFIPCSMVESQVRGFFR